MSTGSPPEEGAYEIITVLKKSDPNGLRYLRWGGGGEAVLWNRC
jgi:hypothetical protein